MIVFRDFPDQKPDLIRIAIKLNSKLAWGKILLMIDIYHERTCFEIEFVLAIGRLCSFRQNRDRVLTAVRGRLQFFVCCRTGTTSTTACTHVRSRYLLNFELFPKNTFLPSACRAKTGPETTDPELVGGSELNSCANGCR